MPSKKKKGKQNRKRGIVLHFIILLLKGGGEAEAGVPALVRKPRPAAGGAGLGVRSQERIHCYCACSEEYVGRWDSPVLSIRLVMHLGGLCPTQDASVTVTAALGSTSFKRKSVLDHESSLSRKSQRHVLKPFLCKSAAGSRAPERCSGTYLLPCWARPGPWEVLGKVAFSSE